MCGIYISLGKGGFSQHFYISMQQGSEAEQDKGAIQFNDYLVRLLEAAKMGGQIFFARAKFFQGQILQQEIL